MPENAKKPQIRFKGFTDAWEQRKLGDVADITSGFMGDALLNNGKFKITRIETIADGFVDENRVGFTNVKPSDSYLLKPGDILYSNINSITHMGKVAQYQGKTRLYHGINLLRLSPNNNINTNFLIQILKTKEKRNWAKSHANQAVSQASINQSLLASQNLYICSLDEQYKIGMYFKNINNLITLHQRKLDKLKNIKKSMLEKMFPKNGSNVPEIRFKGFTDAWEQRKVTELGKIYIGLVTTMTKHYTSKGTLLIRNSDIKDGRFEFGEEPIYLDEYFAKENLLRMHKIGDVITVHTGDVGTSAVIGEKEENSIGFATIVTRPNSQIIDSNYLSTFLNTDKHKKWAVAISTGDGRTNYNLGDYYKLTIPLPILQEQKAIATFITKINNLITLHQRKLEKLKNIKKACLEKMFV